MRDYFFGKPVPPGGVDEIPQRAREAHHRLMNTAMAAQQLSRDISRDADVLIEVLARDLQRRRGE